MKSFLKHVFRAEHIGFALVLFAASLCRFGCALIACTSWINGWTPMLVVFGAGSLLFDVGIRWCDMSLSRSLAIDHMCGLDVDVDKMLADSEINVAGTVTHHPPPGHAYPENWEGQVPVPEVIRRVNEARAQDRTTQLDIRAPLSAEELAAIESLRRQGLATEAALEGLRRSSVGGANQFADDTPEPHPLPAITGLDPKDDPNAPQ